MNNITLSGRITKEPEMSLMNDGTTTYSINTIAVRRTKEKTDFIPFIAWDKQAEFMGNYIHKGDFIIITGELQVDTYENSDGMKRTRYQVLVRNIELVSTKQKEEAEPTHQETKPSQKSFDEVDTLDIPDDELPF